MKLSRQTFFNRIALRRLLLICAAFVLLIAPLKQTNTVRAEAAHEATESSLKQACCTWHVIVTASGTSVNNWIRASVNGVLVLDRAWGWDDSWGYNVFITQASAPSVGVGLRDHVTGSQYNAACGGPTPPYTFQECVEDDFDNDYNDLNYQFAVILVDTTPPTTTHSLAGTTGNNGYYTSNVVVTLNATDSGGGTVSSTTLDSSAYVTPRTISTEGTTAHTYFSVDNSSNTETTKNFTLKIDKTVPTSAFTTHSSGAILYSTVTLGGTTTDATSGVAGMQLSTDSGATWNTATLIGGNLWSYALNTTTLSDGNRTLQIRATDNAGNVQTPVTSLNVFISNAPPDASLDLSCPLSGDDGWCRAPVNVVLSGGSIGAPVNSVTYNIDDGTDTTVGGNKTSFGLTGGIHTAKGYVTNSVGKNSATQSGTAKVDGAAPDVEFRGASRSSLFFRVADNESGMKRWTLQVFDTSGASVFFKESSGVFSGELPWDASSFIGNEFSVDIFARDVAGNENAVKRAKLTLNQIATAVPTPTNTATRAPAVVRPAATATPTSTPTTPAIAQLPPSNQPLTSSIQPPATGDSLSENVHIQIPPLASNNLPPPADTTTDQLVLILLMILLGGGAGLTLGANQETSTQWLMALMLLLTTLGGTAFTSSQKNVMDVPLRTQDKDSVDCGPAALGMMFDFIDSKNPDIQKPNHEELTNWMRTKDLMFTFGTGVDELAYTAREKGYAGTYRFCNASLEKLQQEISEGRPVIVAIKEPNYKQSEGHFVVATGFSDDGKFVFLNDSLRGQIVMPRDVFSAAWELNGGCGVVVAAEPIPSIPESTAPLFGGLSASLALASLAALGTNRKGIGAARADDESSWSNYTWYEPSPQPADNWYDSRVYDEGPHEVVDTWTPPSYSGYDSRDVDSGAHEQSSEQKQELVDALADQERERQRQQQLQDSGSHEQTAEEKQKLVDVLQQQRDQAEQNQHEAQMVAEEEAKQKAMEEAQQRVMTTRNGQQGYVVDGKFVALTPEPPKEKSWWDGLFTDPVDIAQQTLIKAGQSNPLIKALLVGEGKKWDLYNGTVNKFLGGLDQNPEIAKDLQGVKDTWDAALQIPQVYSDIFGMGMQTIAYTGKATIEGRWDDALRGFQGIVEESKAMSQLTWELTPPVLLTKMAVGIVTTTIEDAWRFRQVASDVMYGEKDNRLDVLYTAGRVLFDVITLQGATKSLTESIKPTVSETIKPTAPVEPVDPIEPITSWKPGRPSRPVDIKPAEDPTKAPIVEWVWGHPDSRNAPANTEGLVGRVFDGDAIRFDEFLDLLDDMTPSGSKAIVRGSSVNGYKWINGKPFDTGPLPSDVDIVLVGDSAFDMFSGPTKHFSGQTQFLSADVTTHEFAPRLVDPLSELESLVGRSVNIVAMKDWLFNFRKIVQRAPYLPLVEK